MRSERVQRIHVAVEIHLDDFTRFDLTDELCTDNIERHGFGSEQGGVTDLAHLERTNAQRITAGDHPFGRHDDQGVCPFE